MIYSLESSVNSQTNLNNCYSVFVDLTKAEMLDKLKVKEICANSAISNKRRRSKKPWWSETLTELWNNLCCAEKEMLKSRGHRKKELRRIFVQRRKCFDKEVQKCKRIYWKKQQDNIENLLTSNSQQFWKEIGKIGVGQERRKRIPMEVVREDGTTSNDMTDILQVWQDSFQTLLNSSGHQSVNVAKLLKPGKYKSIDSFSYYKLLESDEPQ
ncbi:unnamed protein product [Mytilus edulis]|uniref:Uncharacterized protein n=1 Tax=Mytilus edulis TaxID=6550 RepID=A0A8S3STR1_MYTED|nr:unnamed protein product [Mytilus edulis]